MITTRTPLRVSFFGGGTDLPAYARRHGGTVLASTIDKYIHIEVRPRADGRYVVRHSSTEVVDDLDDMTHDLARECLRLVPPPGGIEITSTTDAPLTGCGLGTSSAFTVGLLQALLALAGRSTDAAEVAELACRVEIDLLGQPIGKQDQYSTALGGFRQMWFDRDGSVRTVPVEVPAEARERLTAHLKLVFTGQTRKAAEVLRRWRPDQAATESRYHALKQMTGPGRHALTTGDTRELGRLLDLSWQHKRALSQTGEADAATVLYEAARAAGSHGGKLLGAGGGGYFLLVCPPEAEDRLARALRGHPVLPFTFTDEGATVVRHDAGRTAGSPSR